MEIINALKRPRPMVLFYFENATCGSLNDLTPPVFSYLDKNTIRLKGYEVHEELEIHMKKLESKIQFIDSIQ